MPSSIESPALHFFNVKSQQEGGENLIITDRTCAPN